MYLNNCSQGTYFEITEIWFRYKDRINYSKRGITEESIIYIIENNDNYITVSSENIETIFTNEEAYQICGNPLEKKPKYKILHR